MRHTFIRATALCLCLAMNAFWSRESEGQNAVSITRENINFITISPMAEPVPALKYRLWKAPPAREPGSVNAGIARALVMYLSDPNRDALGAQYSEKATQWLESSTADADLKQYLDDQRAVLRAIYKAAELETIESQSMVRQLKGGEVFDAMFSEVQAMRSLANLVQLDARVAIREHRFEDAIRSISAGFRLAEYMQKSGDANLLTGLVSLALSGIACSSVEELSQQPDAPNLYWAIASLPDELWNVRGAIDGETQSIERVLYPLMEPLEPSMKASDWYARLLETIETAFESGDFDAGPLRADEDGKPATKLTSHLVAGAILLLFSDRAAQTLIDAGYRPEQVRQMSASERVVRGSRIELAQRRDDLFKWALLGSAGKPYSSNQWKLLEQQTAAAGLANPANMLFGSVVPSIQAAETAALRGDTQRKQLLLCEALRAHAASHDGTLPESLADLQPLPSLPDPNTKQLFDYRRLSPTQAIVRRQAFFPDDQNEIRIELRVSSPSLKEKR